MRLVAAIAVVAVSIGACGEASPPSPVGLAERHIECHNSGDVDGFLAAFAADTVVMGIGTVSDPEVVEAVAYALGSVQGAEGFVGTCEPWGDRGAKCEGSVYDRVATPAGLSRHLTLTYRFDSEGEIVQFGEMDVYPYRELYRYARELASWVTSTYPELAPIVTEYGLIKKTGADVIELLIPLAEEFIAQSDAWPMQPHSS